MKDTMPMKPKMARPKHRKAMMAPKPMMDAPKS